MVYNLVYLALFLTPSVLGYAARDSSSSVTKSFKFKVRTDFSLGNIPSCISNVIPLQDDLFLKFHPLDNAIGPSDIGTLMQALEDFAPSFKRIWKQQVETKLLGGGCKVDVSFVFCSVMIRADADLGFLSLLSGCEFQLSATANGSCE